MRKKRARIRQRTPDPKYNDVLVAQFINNIMKGGKKNVAQRIIYGSFELIEQRTKNNPLDVFKKAVHNTRPMLEVKARRVGGATYQVPVDVAPLRGSSLAMRWIRDFARKKKGKSMMNKLADELISAYKQEGAAIKKRDETHKMAEANKAFSHFRW